MVKIRKVFEAPFYFSLFYFVSLRCRQIYIIMKRVSSKEFLTHQERYYEDVLEPDDDLRRAISADEFKKRCLLVIDNIFGKGHYLPPSTQHPAAPS